MSYSSEVLSDSPTHFWKLWDATGPSAVDSSGNSRNATYNASPTLHATSPLDVDASAFAVTLNGTSQYISRAAEASINSSVWCFEIIAKINGGAGNFRVIASTRDENTNNGWLLYLNDSNKLDLRHGGGGTVILQAGTVSVGSTVHIVIGHNGTKFFMYVNGTIEASNPTAAYTASSTALNIGRRTDASFFAPVTVQHAAHYSSMLSGTRVSAHYTAATTIAPATGSGNATFSLIPALSGQKIIDAQGTSFALVPNSSSLISASGGVTTTLTPTLPSQILIDQGGVSFTLTPTEVSDGLVLAQVTETDLAQPVTSNRSANTGQATETDSAQAVTVNRTKSVGQATETDSAFAATSRHTASVAQATESDSAFTTTPEKTVEVSQPVEGDEAFSITGRTVRSVGQAVETDATIPLISGGRSFSLGQPVEHDIAFPVLHDRHENVSQPVETDTAQPVTWVRIIHAGQATDTQLAQATTVVRSFSVGQAVEAALAQAVTHMRGFTVAQATEGDTSQTVLIARSYHLGRADETDTAQAVTELRRFHVGQALEQDITIPFPQFIDVAQGAESELAQATTVDRGFDVELAVELDEASAFDFTRGHTYRVRIGQDLVYAPHANPKKHEQEGIVKTVKVAYESVYSHPVNPR